MAGKSLRVALINSAMDLGQLGRYSQLFEPMPVLGIASLCAVAKQAGHKVRAYDQFVSGATSEQLADRIANFKPDVVGVGILTPAAEVCEQLTARVRRLLPSCCIVAGNIHADFFAEDVLNWGSVDVVVHGEGEQTFADLLDSLANGAARDELDGVAGLSYRNSVGEICRGPERPLITDLDSLPLPAWEHLPIHNYGLLPLADLAKPTLVMSASRGCPYRCEFCSLLHAGAGYRRRSPEAVVEEYASLHWRFGARQIGFVDPIFPLNKKVCHAFCEGLLSRGLDQRVVWISETRVDAVDRETLRLMRRSGCRRLLFGIESGVDLLLEKVTKDFSTERAREAVALCQEEGIETVGLFMLGLPGETRAMTEETIRFSCDIGLDFAKYAITIPFPGSQLYADLVAEGRLNRNDWDNWTTFQPNPDLLPFVPRDVTNAELIALQRAATRRFYLRPTMVFHQLFKVRSIGPRQVLHGLRSLL
jgi:radical SAM superfamily enzyme YgiQ (UPF0313 family)